FTNYLGFHLQEYHFNNVFRIGKGTNRPILIKLNSFITKQQILDNARMLKGSNYKLDNDYDFNTRQIRKKLLPFMHEARDIGHRANIINDKLKINGKIYDLDHLENEFTNVENFEHIHNRKHRGRNRSNSPTLTYNESPNWLLRRRRFSSSERGRQEEEIEQLNYKIPRSPSIRSSTDERLENSRKSRSEERRTRVTKKPHFSNEIGMSASAVEFRPSTRRQSKSPEGRNQDVDGTAVTRLRSENDMNDSTMEKTIIDVVDESQNIMQISSDHINPEWQIVRSKKRRYDESVISPSTSQVAALPTHNSFDPLRNITENVSHTESLTPHKPPPIFVPGVINVPEFINCLRQKVSQSDFSYKMYKE
ncbi:hypothetical protein C0J52_27560, partial [Blattella germanica]